MKTTVIIAVLCLASCRIDSTGGGLIQIGRQRPNIVVNRDAAGRYMNPNCPVCLKDADGIAALYRCPNGHKYQTTFKPPTP